MIAAIKIATLTQEGFFLQLLQIQKSLNGLFAFFVIKEDLQYAMNNDPQGTLSPKTEQ